MKRPNPPSRSNAPWTLWALFGVWTLTNVLLSYAPFFLSFKVLLFLFGILVPFAIGLKKLDSLPALQNQSHSEDYFKKFTPWLVTLGLVTGLVLRFWRITKLFLWPTGDEALHAQVGLSISRGEGLHFFNTVGQNPPTLFWISGLFFKCFQNPFFNIWFPPALISTFTLAAGYFVARHCSQKSFALIYTGLWAFSYWPLYLGRTGVEGIVVPLAELLTFLFLVKFLKAEGPEKKRWAFVLGLSVGAHSFTFVAWPFFVSVLSLFLFFEWRKMKRDSTLILIAYMGGMFLALTPFLYSAVRSGYGQHIFRVASWSNAAGWGPFRVSMNYLAVLGWGVSPLDSFCAPLQGGFLNPPLTAFFLLGLLQAWKGRSRHFFGWLLGSFAFFLFPGFLSLNMDSFRIVLILPLLLWVTALGIQGFLWTMPTWGRGIGLGAILLFTALFDPHRLWMPYQTTPPDPSVFMEAGKSLSRYRAFEVIRQKEKEEGPGIVLGEWDIPADRSLQVTSYFFNAAMNPQLDPNQAHWAALVADRHYLPFLRKRFPSALFKALDPDLSSEGTRMLVLFKIEPEDRETFLRWARADQAFQDLNWGIDHIYDRDCLERVDRKIQQDYPLIQGDPFLESAFWEKTANFYYYYSGHYPEHLKALQLAVTRGYPAAHLYYQLAGLYQVGGQTALAQEASRMAKASETDFPWRKVHDIRGN